MLSGKTYSSRKVWWEHERERHRVRRSWNCAPCEHEKRQSVFENPTQFDEHIAKHHPQLTPTQLRNIRDICQRDIGIRRPQSICPLCKETILCKKDVEVNTVERSVRKHVSDHLEQIAFFVAFPTGQMLSKEDDSEFQDDSDSDDGIRTEIKSIASKDTHLSKKDIHIATMHRFIADQEKAEHAPGGIAIPGISVAGDQGQQTVRGNDGESTRIQGLRTEAPLFPIRILMHPPNEHFYARQSFLADADKVLRTYGSICIFHGVGGVGKTLAAVHYIYTHQNHYDAIFWLQADTAPGLSDSFFQMAMALGLIHGIEDHRQVMDKGRTWLQETGLNNYIAIFRSAS